MKRIRWCRECPAWTRNHRCLMFAKIVKDDGNCREVTKGWQPEHRRRQLFKRIIEWVSVVVLLVTLTGCGGQDYLLASGQAKMEVVKQLRVINLEDRAFVNVVLDSQENQIFKDLKESLLAKPIDQARVDVVVAALQVKLKTITEGRTNEFGRASLAEKLLAYLEQLSSQDMAIVIRQSNDLDQLKALVLKAYEGVK